MAAEPEVFNRLSEFRVIPVVVVDRMEAALPLADALIAGGLPVAEITFRTQAAAEVIHLLTQERPQLLVGAGTVLNVHDAKRAKEAGAQFAVAPGLNPEVVKASLDWGLPFAPGVMTPTEVETAVALGLHILKYFPAEAAGGLKFLKSIHSPYRHLGVRFIPTGGVSTQNLASYLASEAVLAVGGTWIAKQDIIAGNHWEAIRDNCSRVCLMVSGNAP